MTGTTVLHVLAPGLLGPVPAGVATALPQVGDLSTLERLLSRARRDAVPEATPDSLVGHLLGREAVAAGPLAAAAVAGDREAAYWSRAGGCHLIADRDRLMVHAGPALRPDPDEAQALAASFNRQFAGDGWELIVRDGAMVLASDDPLPGGLAPLSRIAGRYLDDYLPGGSAERRWRAVLNETQMLLFDHPVNEARAERGVAPVNGLWFWGCGPACENVALALDRVHADDAVVAGLGRLAGARVAARPERLSSLEPRAGMTVVHWPDAEDALLAGEAMAWLESLARFEERWAREAAAALDNGTWAEIAIHTDPGWCWRLSRGNQRRFWRRRRALSRFLVAE